MTDKELSHPDQQRETEFRKWIEESKWILTVHLDKSLDDPIDQIKHETFDRAVKFIDDLCYASEIKFPDMGPMSSGSVDLWWDFGNGFNFLINMSDVGEAGFAGRTKSVKVNGMFAPEKRFDLIIEMLESICRSKDNDE